MYLNETTIRLSPSVPSGVVRLQRETDIDQSDHAYRAGAKFIAQTMDENFEQLRHSQQEVRDGFGKLKDDTYAIIDTLEEVAQSAQEAADDANAAAQVANAAAAQVVDKVSQAELDAAVSPLERYTPLPYELQNYVVGQRVTLSTGEIVENLVPDNNVDPNTNMLGWVKVNSASRIYDESGLNQQKINDLHQLSSTSIFKYMSKSELDLFLSSTPRTFDFSEVINRVCTSMSGVEGGTKQVIYFPAITGGYLLTSGIWQPKGVGFKGDGGVLWNTDLEDVSLKSSLFYADFTDKNQFIISTDVKLKSTGVRLAYDAYFTGAQSDSGLYTLCDGASISGIQIHAKNRVFGGIRYYGAVGSYIAPDVVVTNCEYAYLTSACWDSIHLGKSKYGKCGYLGYDQNNSTEVGGYHNPIGAYNSSFTNMLNFFESGYDIPHTLMNTTSKQFGAVIKKADNIKLNRLTVEKTDFNIVLYDRANGVGDVYCEITNVGGITVTLGNQCTLTLTSNGGAVKDGDAIQLGTNARLYAPNYRFILENGNHMYSGMPWSPTAFAFLPSRYFPEYNQNILWSDKNDNIVYLSTSGADSANGANYYVPTNLTAAIKRISNERERYDSSLVATTNKTQVFYLIESGEYTLTEPYLSLTGKILIKRKSNLTTATTVLNMNNFVYLSDCDLSITGVTVKIPNKTYDYVTWARNAPFINNGGINSLCLSAAPVVFNGVSNGIASYANYTDSLFNLNIQGGAITGTGDIVQTPELITVGNVSNVNIGESCVVDGAIKAKVNSGINITKNQQGLIVLPWRVKNVSASYAPPSIAANQKVSTTVTMAGVRVGDIVSASFDQYNQSISITAVVSANDTVTIVFANTSAVAVNLASGNLNVSRI